MWISEVLIPALMRKAEEAGLRGTSYGVAKYLNDYVVKKSIYNSHQIMQYHKGVRLPTLDTTLIFLEAAGLDPKKYLLPILMDHARRSKEADQFIAVASPVEDQWCKTHKIDKTW